MNKQTNEFHKFLVDLDSGVEPTIHVNGVDHPTAVVVVDFGTPLKPLKLSPEQTQEVTLRLRRLTTDMTKHDETVRVNTDFSNGVFWSSLI